MSERKPWKLIISEQGSETPEEIFEAVGHALTVWENLINELAFSFGYFVGSHHIVALRALGRIESPAARIQVVQEAYRSSSDEVRSKFPNFDGLVTEAIMATEVRNAIAHGSVRWMELGNKNRVNFLMPSLATTRKFAHPERVNQKAITQAGTESEVLREMVSYAFSAKDVDFYRFHFVRLLEGVKSCKIPPSSFVIPAKEDE